MEKSNQLFNQEQQIIHRLLLNAPFIPSVGLLTGQVGIALAFYTYYRHTECAVYGDFAGELLDNALESLDKSIDIAFSNGLTGIGWGIEYLILKGFVDGCGVEICENIDQKIMESDPRRISDLSLEQGLEGLIHYVLIHISASIKQNVRLPFDSLYLKDLYTVVKQACQEDIPDSFRSLAEIYMDFIEKQEPIDYPLHLFSFIDIVHLDTDKLTDYPLGIKDGLAGLLLKEITNE
ncbi:hypothetical protein KCV26_13890 [Petrimonas sulfuriphila]|jgi:hypothetical protein|uniref:hypothetical protein n=1 Tax=Dysgonomonadaceae TaxID=2005520 RepID=UPI0025803633|nr:hypothetical protein [Proteiniphilum sp. UBA5346]